MVFWYVLILLVALVNAGVCREGFYEDYLGKERTNAVKGLFILLVFLGHALTDIKRCGRPIDSGWDLAAHQIHWEMGQLVVVLFLFYSGYGVMRSLMTKGEEYLVSYPRKRLLTTLLNFDVAVLCFAVLNWVAGQHISLRTLALSLIAWDNIGNSNWYIFVILLCFLAFYLVFKVVRSRYLAGAFLLLLVLFAGMLFLHETKNPIWYNTMLVFPVGVFYALYADRLERIIQKRYWLWLVLLAAAFLFLHFVEVRPLHGLTHNAQAVLFGLLVVVLSMKIRIGNKWLVWCGASLFPLYIYERLPMNAFKLFAGEAWVARYPNVFIGVSFAVTVGIALLYNKYFRIRLK